MHINTQYKVCKEKLEGINIKIYIELSPIDKVRVVFVKKKSSEKVL